METIQVYLNHLSETELKNYKIYLLESIAYMSHDYSTAQNLYEDVAKTNYLRGQLDLIDTILTNFLPLN